MVSYFASASALGRLARQGSVKQRRGNERDAVQVLANGGPAALCAFVHAVAPQPWREFALTAFYGSLASAAADTWATEIGTRWGGLPRRITTLRKTFPGESGSVTPIGLAASALAALAVAGAAQTGKANRRVLATSCVAGGIAGSLADSLLGALVQEQRWCAHCSTRTELAVHTCGFPSQHLSGVPAVDNDVVNLLGVIVGGLASVAASATLSALAERNRSRVEFSAITTSSRLPSLTGAL